MSFISLAAGRNAICVVGAAHLWERWRRGQNRASASSPKAANRSGGTYSTTGRCFLVGCRYFVRGQISPSAARSRAALRRSRLRSRPGRASGRFGEEVLDRHVLARRRTLSERSYVARDRTPGVRRRTVSRLWLKTSGRAARTAPIASLESLKSGVSTSIAGRSHMPECDDGGHKSEPPRRREDRRAPPT